MGSARKKKARGGGWLLFWLAFFIGITLLFAANLERIKETLRQTNVLERFFSGASGGGADDELERHIRELASEAPDEDSSAAAAEVSAGERARNGDAETAETISPAKPVPLDETAAEIAARQAAAEAPLPGTAPQTESAVTPQNAAVTQPAAAARPAAKTVERVVYLMKVDSAGAILWTSVKRDLPSGDSPLLDTLNALIQGPSAEEEKRGLISLIPKNAAIRNAVVRGSTAYINFSEDFLFNTYGVEGYAGQRKQIVLTATEFSNVKDVQILIEGKRVDYLGEGVWIGSPVGRNML